MRTDIPAPKRTHRKCARIETQSLMCCALPLIFSIIWPYNNINIHLSRKSHENYVTQFIQIKKIVPNTAADIKLCPSKIALCVLYAAVWSACCFVSFDVYNPGILCVDELLFYSLFISHSLNLRGVPYIQCVRRWSVRNAWMRKHT